VFCFCIASIKKYGLCELKKGPDPHLHLRRNEKFTPKSEESQKLEPEIHFFEKIFSKNELRKLRLLFYVCELIILLEIILESKRLNWEVIEMKYFKRYAAWFDFFFHGSVNKEALFCMVHVKHSGFCFMNN
jgi:hypothetical protein